LRRVFAHGQLRDGLWAQWSATLAAALATDPAAFHQWFAGVILTGMLLGLGTPFWVQTVSAAVNARRWAEKKEEKPNRDEA
jgi:hypothetical protein